MRTILWEIRGSAPLSDTRAGGPGAAAYRVGIRVDLPDGRLQDPLVEAAEARVRPGIQTPAQVLHRERPRIRLHTYLYYVIYIIDIIYA